MFNFKNFLSESTVTGNVVVYGLLMQSQAHLWHLLIKSGQKHSALQFFYEGLNEKIDELAEMYIARNGSLSLVNFELDLDVSIDNILTKTELFRSAVNSAIEANRNNSSTASILDALTDIQELIDSFVYKFNLE